MHVCLDQERDCFILECSVAIMALRWRDSTEVEQRTADSKVPGLNPGGGTTKKNRSFHDPLRLGLISLFVRSFVSYERLKAMAFLEFDLLQCAASDSGVLNPYAMVSDYTDDRMVKVEVGSD